MRLYRMRSAQAWLRSDAGRENIGLPKRMMLPLLASLAFLAVGLFSQPNAAFAQVPPSLHGVWVNPSGTVKVETGTCADRLCGWVVWASPDAIDDAREGGTEHLLGTRVLSEYDRVAPGTWQGNVFVPDHGATFFSNIREIDGDSIRISGCLLHGLLCKSQVWRRA